MFFDAHHLAPAFGCAFLAVAMLRSAVDMLVDRRGNLAFLKQYFDKTGFRSFVPLLLNVTIVLELISGLAAVAGGIELVRAGAGQVATLGASLSAATLLCLFFGQQLAKDHPGAGRLTGYVLIALLTLWMSA